MFAEPERAQVRTLLERKCADNLPLLENATPENLERVRFAALKLSGGDLGKLRRAIQEAQIDWRDVLVQAGFANDVTAHTHWRP